MDTLLSPRQFAAAIGVSESSVRRWADSGLIRITRTAGGHRKITRTDAIRFVRSNDANVVRPDLLEINEPQHRRGRTKAFAAQHDELFVAMRDGQAELVHGLVQTMYLNGVTVAEICDGPIRYAMNAIGDLWPNDKRAIFVEHRATSLCVDVLNQLGATLPAATSDTLVAIGGAPEGDPFLLPSLMANTVLADLGFQPVNLGANTPLDVLARSAMELKARLVWVAVTTPISKATFETEVASLVRRLARRNVDVALGGRGLARYDAPTSARVHRFSSMTEMAGFAKTLRKTS